jgi:DNA-binding beta-propeller fold protein YncE
MARSRALAMAIALLAGCSGGASVGPSSSLPNNVVTASQILTFHALNGLDPSGIAPESLSRVHFGHVQRPASRALRKFCKRGPPCGNVYIADSGTLAVEALLNVTYTDNGSITGGVTNPDGDWTDSSYNLYVANFFYRSSAGNVQEYACVAGHTPGCTNSPSFTYTGLIDPVNGTTDRNGNLFVLDYGTDTVNEYRQKSNTIVASCPISGGTEGVAVDSSAGDVFVSYNNFSDFANIIKFAGGLTGCSGTVLGATLSFSGGMILDSAKNLIIADQFLSTVDIIPPPYTSITRTCGREYDDPFHVALTRDNARLYVADSAFRDASVHVLNYPACTKVTTLSGGAIVQPYGVTDTYNFVP